MRTEAARRGVTLIELMVSVAIIAVILAAVTSVVASVTRQRRESSNLIEVRANARVALTMIQFDGTNAGFRFGASPFAVRVLQNATTTAAAELADAANCGGRAGWEIIPGSDVVEFREGADGISVGRVPLGGCNPNGSGIGVNCFNAGGSPNPFVNMGDGQNSVVFFSSQATACAARLTGPVSAGTFVRLNQDLRTNATATTYPMTGTGQCPADNMTITALGQVTRYMVCRPPAMPVNPLLRPGLFRQRFGPTFPLMGSQTEYVEVQEGVEDLQVATLLSLATNPGMVTGATCTGAGLGATCWCGLVAGDCAQYDFNPTATGTLDGTSTTAAQRSAFLPRAYRVAVTTLSTRSRGFSDQRLFSRPALFNNAAGAVLSGDHRTVLETTIIPQNIVMVSP